MEIKKIAIIPARLGSKRIKKKNIKEFISKPMIYWTLKKLINSQFFDKIIVSSDSSKILKISKKFGADITIQRPNNLATDLTPTQPVIAHVIDELEKKNNLRLNFVCCVYPCNPFLQIKDIKKGYAMLKKNMDKYVFPVTEYSHPIQRALKIKKNSFLVPFFKKNTLIRTQELKKTFFDAGQFYWSTRNNWLHKINIHSDSIGITLPSWRVIDIDNLDDWKRAELLFKIIKN
jgi:pseudaminic acid cytidylyltransferase